MKYPFGDKLRTIRERKNLTMKTVANLAGISESMISQIETNKVSPAMDTLLTLIDILDIDLAYLFGDLKPKKKVNVVKANARHLKVQDGVTYEHLISTPQKDPYGIEAYYMTILPGKSSGSNAYGHQGKELGVILEGSGILTLDGETYLLNPGDSISFDSDVPHQLKNNSTTSLKTFWVITPPKRFD